MIEIWKNTSLEDLPGEEWRDIGIFKDVDYTGIYQVSNLGRVKSLNRYRKNKYGNLALIQGRVLKLQCPQYRYSVICLSLESRKVTSYVHQIVGQTFIPNPLNKPQINHINGIKTDNRVKNLEWANASENIQHSYDIGLVNMSPERIKRAAVLLAKYVMERRRPVLMLSLTDEPLVWFESSGEAGRMTKAQ